MVSIEGQDGFDEAQRAAEVKDEAAINGLPTKATIGWGIVIETVVKGRDAEITTITTAASKKVEGTKVDPMVMEHDTEVGVIDGPTVPTHMVTTLSIFVNPSPLGDVWSMTFIYILWLCYYGYCYYSCFIFLYYSRSIPSFLILEHQLLLCLVFVLFHFNSYVCLCFFYFFLVVDHLFCFLWKPESALLLEFSF